MAVTNPRNAITGRPQIKAVQAPAPRQVILPPKVSPAELQKMLQNRDQAMKLAEQSRLNAQQLQQKADQMRKALPVRPAPPSNTGNIKSIPKTPPPPVKPTPRVITDPIQKIPQPYQPNINPNMVGNIAQPSQMFYDIRDRPQAPIDQNMVGAFAGVGALPSPEYDIVGNEFIDKQRQYAQTGQDYRTVTQDQIQQGQQANYQQQNILSQIPAYAQMQALQGQLQGQQPNPQQLSQLQMFNQQIQNNPQMQQFIQQQQGNFGGGIGQPQVMPPQGGLGGQLGGIGQPPYATNDIAAGMAAGLMTMPNYANSGSPIGGNPQTQPFGQTMAQTGFAPMGGFQNIGSLLGKG